jgi:hypothetical protein
VFLAILAVLLLFGGAGTTQENDAARSFLAASFNMTGADFHRLEQGQVVSRTMDVSDSREVATFGVVRVRITPEFYVERLADIASFKRDEAVLQIGTFSNPPDMRDVSDLTLDDPDVRSLRRCRIGNCGVQLSADAISRFQRDVDWQRPDAQQQANALMREILVEYVAEYLKAGSAMEYADRPEPVNIGREFLALAKTEAGGWKQFPALRRHLVEFPATDARETKDLVYWSKEKVGRKTVASVTHLAISRTADESPADYAVASKHIYGTHYFDASLGLTVLLRDRSASTPVTYLAYANRSRVDVLGGMLGGVRRKIVSSRARATVSGQLARIQRTLESQFTAEGGRAKPGEQPLAARRVQIPTR